MIFVVITGPESSGKSSLAEYLSKELDAVLVPEYARQYLELNGSNYDLNDIVNIGFGQFVLAEALKAENKSNRLIICDTWMLELRIWTAYRYGKTPEVLETMYAQNPPDIYMLCKPDIDWEPDPLRENPHDREVLYEMYHKEIVESNIPCIIVSGQGEGREKNALVALKGLLAKMGISHTDNF